MIIIIKSINLENMRRGRTFSQIAILMIFINAAMSDDHCNLIDAGFQRDGSDIIKNGVLQPQFSWTASPKEKLYYMPFERMSQSIYLNTPVALTENPIIRSSERQVSIDTKVNQLTSNDANKLLIEVQQNYYCPTENFAGMTYVNMTLKFQGCP